MAAEISLLELSSFSAELLALIYIYIPEYSIRVNHVTAPGHNNDSNLLFIQKQVNVSKTDNLLAQRNLLCNSMVVHRCTCM